MVNNAVDKSSLKYLGEDYQYKLVKEFMEDKSCFKDLAPIIDQNMFTGQYLRTYVGTMLEYLKKHGDVPSYSSMAIELRQRAHTQADIEICEGVINKIKNTPSDGADQTKELATKFFKQQNIIKAANEMLKLAGNGDLENYDKCEELLKNALNTGNHEDYEESRLFDGIDETLSNDFRIVIPTGIGKIDQTLNGGIGKGELGCIVGPSGYGKVQPYDAKVVTPDGYVEMRDIHVGSMVIGADGKAHKVTAVFPHKNWDFYKVTFNDGTSTECGKEHLWNVNTYTQKKEGDYSYKTMSLEEIMNSDLFFYNTDGDSIYNFQIPIAKPVEFNEINVGVDPYLMGKLISSNSFSWLTEENEDEELRIEFLKYYDKSISQETKRIHHDYLFNSVENRISLLNGLMDYSGKSIFYGDLMYSTKSKDFAYDVKQLVLSLGGFAYIQECGDSEICYYVIGMLYDRNISVFRNKYKQAKIRYSDERWYGKCFKNIEFSRKADGQCILVDSDDHLYLTDDFIVTHNTTLTTAMSIHAATYKSEQNDFKGFKVMQIVFEDRIKQIQRKHFSKITQVEACNLSKEEYAHYVRNILDNYPERDLIQENLRIIRLKSGEKSIEFIEDMIRKHINQGFRPDLVVIDYFECIKLTGPSTMSKWDKESGIMRKIEAMANELNVAVWVPVQGNRDSINAELVTMDNAGGSLGKIQISHIIMSVTRSLEDIAENIATISILKNRAGQSGEVIEGAMFNNGTCTISTDNCTDFDSGVAFNKHRESVKEEKQKDLLKEVYNLTKNKQQN